jgi:hypothetical protein
MTLARHPWSTPAGSAQDGSTCAPLRGGSVRWSVELGFRMASDVIADRDGRWFARADGLVVARPAGAELWRRSMPVLRLSLLDDGLVVLSCGESGLVVVEPATGADAWSVPGYYWAASAMDGGALAAVVQRPDWSLAVVESGGVERWTRATGMPVAAPLIRDDGTIVSVSRDRLEAFDQRGAPLWTAGTAGFDGAAAQGRFTTQAVSIDTSRILVGLDAHSWLGYLMVDPVARTGSRWPPPGDRATPAPPLAVRRFLPPFAVVTWLQTRLLVSALDETDRRAEDLPTPPYAFAVDQTGAIAVAYTLDAEYHDRYMWHDEGRALRGRSGVALFDPRAGRRWVWDAPGPIGGFAVSADGDILVTSEGRLWAIG